MHRSFAVSILVSILCFCWSGGVSAEDIGISLGIWDFDSIAPADAANASLAKEVYTTEILTTERWNAHDLEGYLDHFWNSPQLLVVQNGEALEGFQQVLLKYKEGYADRERMGSSRLERVKIRMIDSDIAFALTVWTINYGHSTHATIGTNTEYLQKFPTGWKIISSHASNGDL
jgi:hypothetical protein